MIISHFGHQFWRFLCSRHDLYYLLLFAEINIYTHSTLTLDIRCQGVSLNCLKMVSSSTSLTAGTLWDCLQQTLCVQQQAHHIWHYFTNRSWKERQRYFPLKASIHLMWGQVLKISNLRFEGSFFSLIFSHIRLETWLFELRVMPKQYFLSRLVLTSLIYD